VAALVLQIFLLVTAVNMWRHTSQTAAHCTDVNVTTASNTSTVPLDACIAVRKL
jgi:hypothetical protein